MSLIDDITLLLISVGPLTVKEICTELDASRRAVVNSVIEMRTKGLVRIESLRIHLL